MSLWSNERNQRTPVRMTFSEREEQLAASIWPEVRKRAGGPIEALRVLHLLSVAILRQCHDGPAPEWDFIRACYLETIRDLPVPYRATAEGLVHIVKGKRSLVDVNTNTLPARQMNEDVDVWSWADKRGRP